MNSFLLNRATGSLPAITFAEQYTSRLLHAIQPSDTIFASGDSSSVDNDHSEDDTKTTIHRGGVTTITIDRFEGRYLLSAGVDPSIKIWDLENFNKKSPVIHRPLGAIAKGAAGAHTHGITAVHFYPFDSLAFSTSSYDHTLKIWNSETLNPSASFDLQSAVYYHATSPIADHLLIACATQHPHIRLVDLKSGAAAHALAGHQGAVMSLVWSPKDEHILASGGIDGTIRFWDVRRGAAQLGALDMDGNVGAVSGSDGLGHAARRHGTSRAHRGPVNGLVWLPDGRHVVSAGHDEKMRVWDVTHGANTLTNFGPLLRNRELRSCMPCLPPPGLTSSGREVLFCPSDREILMFEIFEGRMLKRLKTPGQSASNNRLDGPRSKVNELAWRHHHIELYSAHGDGTIRAWKPRTTEDARVEEAEDEVARVEEDERRRKRKALEDVYNDLTKKRFTL